MNNKKVEKTLHEIAKENLKNEIEKIDKLDYEKVNWYELKNEILNIKKDIKEEEEAVLIYEFQKKFINKNKSVVNGYDKDIVIFKVLEELIICNELNIGAIHLKGKEYFIETGVENAVTKALKVLELYEIILKQTIGANNQKGYSLNLDIWFNKSRYKIQDYVVLERLAPIITSFINIGFIDEFNVEKLFDRLSDIIEYAILPSTLHNKYLDIENIITTAIIDNEIITIKIKKNNSYIEKEIEPFKIIYKKKTKYIVYKDIKSNQIEEEELFNCRLVETEIDNIEYINTNLSMLKTEDIKIKQPPKKAEPKQIKLLLECDSVIYEYFNMLPLSNMIIYDEEKKLKEFSKKYNCDFMPNKFYIEALDYKEKIISVIFHCLENVKIIEPIELKNDIIERVKIFTKKNNIDICKEDNTPPTQPIKPDNKQTLKEETPIENNENIEIDKNGLVEKIKNSKGGNFNL